MPSKKQSNHPPSAIGYLPVIGLEIHVELKTVSKMFCGCRNDPFHAPKPNMHTCPVCLGLPGALPVPNKKAIEWTAIIGKTLGCDINPVSKFDRKHYFYPDLPKGYQISQYDQPIAERGRILVGPSGKKEKEVKIRRVHLEEDTGKLLHQVIKGENLSLVDFNRSGVPLVEIVTEPDIKTFTEARWVAEEIQFQIKERLGFSDADMEKGQMRLEANVSVSKEGSIPDYKVEVKNINSFRFLEKAIEFELKRQMDILKQGKRVVQETRGWDESSATTKPQRTKEEAADYRYFPEPDIPPLVFPLEEKKRLEACIPDDPRIAVVAFSLPSHNMDFLFTHSNLYLKVIDIYNLLDKDRLKLIKLINKLQHHPDVWTGSAKEIINAISADGSEMVSDQEILNDWVEQVIRENQNAVKDYSSGKEQALQALIGAVQKRAKGKANVGLVRNLLLSRISRHPERSFARGGRSRGI